MPRESESDPARKAGFGALRDPEVVWGEDGAPRSRLGDDVYFSVDDGRAETRHVFHGGTGLPDAWRDRPDFAIAELGFGLGLNFFETLDLWRADPRAPRTLRYTSFEWAPPPATAMRPLLARWPDLETDVTWLLEAWPPAPGWSRRVREGEGRALFLTLGIGDANALAPALTQTFDAWFLDGFSPAKNPELWGEALLRTVYARTAPGGAAATYAAAGRVRRALEEAGFEVERRPGYGRKREMLSARRGGA